MARPWNNLPPGARDALLSMAPMGLQESTAARALGMPVKDFRRVIKENEKARELWEEAMSVERDALLTALYNRAIEGDTKAAQHLLSARHGISEKTPEKASDRVQINLQLPPALDPAKYAKLVQGEELPNGDES